jgi:hypothetical protein
MLQQHTLTTLSTAEIRLLGWRVVWAGHLLIDSFGTAGQYLIDHVWCVLGSRTVRVLLPLKHLFRFALNKFPYHDL